MSVGSKVINAIMKKVVNKKIFEDDIKFGSYIERKRKDNSRKFYLNYHFSKEIIVESQKIGGMKYFVFNRLNCKKTIFYFHGGSYVDKPNVFHYRFIEKILLTKDVCVVFPIYPRLPEHTSTECYSCVCSLFNDFISKNVVNEVILMGDSAGGGLALGVAQQVKHSHNYYNNGKQKVILLCPWLDMALDNPEINEILENDYQLSQVGLSKLGKMWAEGNMKVAPASPLYGDIDCGEITIITGTREILYPDNLVLKKKLEDLGKTVNYYEFNDMSHCFMLMPIPEADIAMKKILRRI